MLMGTTVTIDARDADPAAIDRAFGWFRAVEQVCTRFDPESELCRLTMRPARAVPVSPLLFEAVRFALHVADVSGGAFDPTLGAAMQRRGFNREHRTGATVPVMVEPESDVSYRDVEIDVDHHTVTLTRPLLLDLGAVAKGLAIDLAAKELRSFDSVAIDAGGDLYLGGVNGEGQPWLVGIRHPRLPGECIGAVRVSNQAVCTSGDYERVMWGEPCQARPRGPDKVRATPQHHIIDPRTGTSPTNAASVTVLAASAMLADALATAAFVLGPAPGLALLEQLQVEGLFVTSQLEMIHTTGWPGE
jgi:thiamine biosynthesis lipoprotein